MSAQHGAHRVAYRLARFQRARIARRAISRRRWGLSASARAGPPLRPPSRPSATACGFLETSRSRSTAVRSVGAPQLGQGGPISSVNVGSRTSCSASQTRHRRRTSLIIKDDSFTSPPYLTSHVHARSDTQTLPRVTSRVMESETSGRPASESPPVVISNT